MATQPPLGPETLDELKERLKQLDEADVLIDQSIRAGIDMSAQKKRSQDLRGQILRIKQTFFPGQ